MNMIEELRNRKIIIQFNEWNNIKEPVKISLIDYTNATTAEFKKTVYYEFQGYFEDKNKFNVEPFRFIVFHISKKSFDKSIVRLLDFNEINPHTKYKLTIMFKRINKTNIQMNLLTNKQTNEQTNLLINEMN